MIEALLQRDILPLICFMRRCSKNLECPYSIQIWLIISFGHPLNLDINHKHI